MNLEGIKPGEMKLTGAVIADIYLGKIKKWNEKAIADLNPGVKLPDENITVVRRSDGSGTTFLWTDYLSKVSPEWKEKVGASTAVAWPEGVGGKGNEGVASYVQRIKGAIGYVEYAYAKRNKMAHVALRNKDGQFVQPDDDAFQAAAAYADWKAQPGFYQILTEQPGKASWPITGASFILDSGEVGQAGQHGGSAEVLRLGAQERTEDGGGARLRAAAGPGGEDDRRRVARAGEGRRRQGALELIARHSRPEQAGVRERPPVLLEGDMMSSAATASISLPAESLAVGREPNPPSQRRTIPRWQDAVFEGTTRFFALFVLGLLLAILIALSIAAVPAMQKFGLGFFVTDVWNPVTKNFGALAPIYGTLVTSAIALLIGVPVSFGIALFLTEMCPVVAQAAARHGGRAPGGDSRRSSTACGACSSSRRSSATTSSRCCRRCSATYGSSVRSSRARPTASACCPPGSSWRSW